MSCIHSDNDGKCALIEDEAYFVSESVIVSCDEEGYCLVEDDSNPNKSCDSFEYVA